MVNVIDQIAMDINRLIKVPSSSWWAKIKVIKMNITPSRLYFKRHFNVN